MAWSDEKLSNGAKAPSSKFRRVKDFKAPFPKYWHGRVFLGLELEETCEV